MEGKLSQFKQDYKLLLLKRANKYRFNSNKTYYLMENKPGKHLPALTKWIQAKPTIILKDKDSNELIRNNKRINVTLNPSMKSYINQK